MKKLFENIVGWVFWIIIVIIIGYKPIILLFFLLFIVLLFLVLLISNRKNSKEKRAFIKNNNRRIFYLYSSKKRWITYINHIVLPMLNDDIGKIFNDKGTIRCDFDTSIFYSYYYQLDKIKYPLFMKIMNDKAVGVSIYNDLVELHNNTIDVIQFQNQVKQKLSELEKKSQ